jgi:hypothetical protein
MEAETAAEEQRKIVAEAERYDRLISEPAWSEVLSLMADKINTTIIHATNPPENGEGVLANALAKTIQVTRWDAQRELLDTVQGHIKFVRGERDRILEEQKVMDHEGAAFNG